jgi:hypothetical protein
MDSQQGIEVLPVADLALENVVGDKECALL